MRHTKHLWIDRQIDKWIVKHLKLPSMYIYIDNTRKDDYPVHQFFYALNGTKYDKKTIFNLNFSMRFVNSLWKQKGRRIHKHEDHWSFFNSVLCLR